MRISNNYGVLILTNYLLVAKHVLAVILLFLRNNLTMILCLRLGITKMNETVGLDNIPINVWKTLFYVTLLIYFLNVRCVCINKKNCMEDTFKKRFQCIFKENTF